MSKIVRINFEEAEQLRRNQIERTRAFADDNETTLILLNRMSKKPLGPGWPDSKRRNRHVGRAAVRDQLNLSFLLTGNVVDVDIDDPTLLPLAAHFLPESSRYGRYSKRSSHWLYVVDDDIEYESIKTKHGHVEIRTGKRQSAAPGSIHPAGELYEWEDSDPPECVSAYELRVATRFLAAASILTEHWVEVQRDDLAVAVSGVLLRSGYAAEQVDSFIAGVCAICGDDELRARQKSDRLASAIREGKNVPGIPSLRQLLGEDTQIFLDALRCNHQDGDPLPLVRADQIVPEQVHWLWRNRIALGKLTMLVGDPGVSKSTISLDIAARVSRGADFPDGSQCDSPGDVVLITGEDDASDTIVPRFMAAKGDRKRLHIYASAFRFAEEKQRLVDAVLALPNPKLVIFDPITEYFGARHPGDMQEARQMLAPLVELLREHRIACLAISHLNKDQAQSAIYRTTGSVAFVAVARAVFLVARDREEPDRRLFLPIKNNLAPDRDGLALTIRETSVMGITATKAAWDDAPIFESADDLLQAAPATSGRSRLDFACEWLRDQLRAGPVPQKTIKAAAKQVGISSATLRRAKDQIGAGSQKVGEPGTKGYWEWYLK